MRDFKFFRNGVIFGVIVSDRRERIAPFIALMISRAMC